MKRKDGESYTNRTQLSYVLSGSIRFIYKGHVLEAKAGDFTYTPYMSKYYISRTGNPVFDSYSILFNFEDRTLFKNSGIQIIRDYPKEKFDRVMENYGKSNILALSAFYGILADLYSGGYVGLEENDKIPAVSIAAKIINENAEDDIKVDELAKTCGISTSHLYSEFKKKYGCSPIQYKQKALVSKANDYLNDTDLSIEEISEKLGFSNSNYFRRVFKNLTGKSPSQMREMKNNGVT